MCGGGGGGGVKNRGGRQRETATGENHARRNCCARKVDDDARTSVALERARERLAGAGDSLGTRARGTVSVCYTSSGVGGRGLGRGAREDREKIEETERLTERTERTESGKRIPRYAARNRRRCRARRRLLCRN